MSPARLMGLRAPFSHLPFFLPRDLFQSLHDLLHARCQVLPHLRPLQRLGHMPVLDAPIVYEEEVPGVGRGDVKTLHDMFDRLEGPIDEGLALKEQVDRFML